MTPKPSKPSSPANAPKMDPRLAAAIARGELASRKLAADEGGSISIARAARRLGVCQATVLRRWRHHRLIAWKQGGAVRVPVWHFSCGKMLKGIEAVPQSFQSNDPWRVMCFSWQIAPHLGAAGPWIYCARARCQK